LSLSSQKYGVWDPGSEIRKKPIPDLGSRVKKAPDPQHCYFALVFYSSLSTVSLLVMMPPVLATDFRSGDHLLHKTRIMSSIWLTSSAPSFMSPNAGGGRELRGISNEYSCTHGGQINFADPTPYLEVVGNEK
jgi:hypothetical protein